MSKRHLTTYQEYLASQPLNVRLLIRWYRLKFEYELWLDKRRGK